MTPEIKIIVMAVISAALLLRCLYLEHRAKMYKGDVHSLKLDLFKLKMDASFFSDEYIFISRILLRLSFRINKVEVPTYDGSDNEMQPMDAVSFVREGEGMRGMLVLNIDDDGQVDTREPFQIQVSGFNRMLRFREVTQIRLMERRDNKFLDMVEYMQEKTGRSFPEQPHKK